MTNNTIPNVPRELLERVKSLCEYWFVSGQQRHMSATEYKTWHALGFGSSAFTELRALLSAPSPAGVDGLAAVKVWEADADWDDHELVVRLSDAQAIIDGLRGEVADLRSMLATVSKAGLRVRTERDQHAKRIGELEGLLEHASKYIAPGAVLTLIKSTLSAGKEVE